MHIQPRFSHINTDCMDSVEDYDRQWAKRQTYMLRDIRMSPVAQELLTLPEHLSSPPVFCGVRVT
jgi:hypothetical protein